MFKKSTLVVAATAIGLSVYPAPAQAKWVTYTGKACSKNGWPSPCEYWVPARFDPSSGFDAKAQARASAAETAKAKKTCEAKGRTWRQAGKYAVCQKSLVIDAGGGKIDSSSGAKP